MNADDDWERAQRLVATGAGGTLDAFVLRRDKELVFSPDDRAVIGYRAVLGVGLASGDPVGDPEAFPAVVGAFVQRCDDAGWRPAVYGALAEHAPLFEAAGMRTFYVGDEAVIDVERFSLSGGRMRAVRQADRRTRRRGVTVEWHDERDLDPALREELRAIAVAHRNGRREFGFSMSLGDLLGDRFPHNRIVVARSAQGDPLAFQRYIVSLARGALSLDGMRRANRGLSGLNERLIVETVDWARAHDVAEVSLNFAAFRRMMEPGDKGRVAGMAAAVVRAVDGRLGIQLDSLRQFNRKFRPRWVPRIVAYRSATDLPRIGVAAMSAEGFLPFDSG
ncbi:MAG TPA: phosphatidylglycerol lysyltransferase domain-containing protein, partial [Acidimicrobiales bacterium]|nr:phosphatidylglycerol lysyltransferase domain-containing protein [Acidimicrobiales bacterium]